MNDTAGLKDFLLSFEGRIGRQTLWMNYILPYVVISVILGAVDWMLGTGGILGALFWLAALWPSLAIYAKRWHDRGKSGWWVLLPLVPVIGPIWTLIECGCLKGSEGENRYGPDPLAPALEAVFE